ncbi:MULTISPECIES: SIR2 family protein [unclassified Pantoea]|uniref:SIR2 family protein n=1 Tax=unclassified Pantoea TaxID=2630326 RepID=UPI001CD25625|nr:MULTISPECIES: SIR2 family protein [unclassified Pantoea]MCA1179583.1 SIR2 family protein [Pantoea sp. alder69]MCA1251836.1 SIR2 family protein [Pantoea sp. alder70]MCA1267827.1 SIR2 family protein [Pantoea sp. alder81]
MAVKRAYYGSEADRDYFERVFQSANINFLIGSGASLPAIRVLGNIETELQRLIEDENEDGYFEKAATFLGSVWRPHEKLLGHSTISPVPAGLTDRLKQSQDNYDHFLTALERILTRRRTGLLPRRINVFTTNYDMFIEDAGIRNSNIILNDGFNRRANLLGNDAFDAGSFYHTISATGNLYNYKVELPTVNLIKMHGSLSWTRKEEKIIYQFPESEPSRIKVKSVRKKWVLSHCMILPRKEKFKETLLQNVYYDLLRTYSNELDKEATLLIVFGFSFADEHIETLTKKALRNATLKVLVFAYSDDDVTNFMAKFGEFSNVEIIYLPGKNLTFQVMNNIITCYLGGTR